MNCLSSWLSSQTAEALIVWKEIWLFPAKAVSYHTNTQVLGTISTEIVSES